MKRQILFRAQSKQGKRWVKGFYVEQHWDGQIKPVIFNDQLDRGIWVNIDADTLGQFTGFCDKNGKQVFEGDIVRSDQYPFSDSYTKDKYFGEICWDDRTSQFFVYLFQNPESKVRGITKGNTCDITAASVAQCEVIGNVYMEKWAFVDEDVLI